MAVAVCGSIVGVRLQSDNNGLTRQSSAARLAAQAAGLARSDPELAARLATAGYQLDADRETRGALFDVAEANPGVSRVLDTGSAVNAIAENRDGQVLYSGSLDGTLDTWDMATGARLSQLRLSSPLQALATDPDGSLLAGADWAGHIMIWRSGPAGLVKQAEVTDFNPSDTNAHVTGIGFFDSGQRIFAVSSDGDAAVYSTKDANQVTWPSSISETLPLAAVSAVDSPEAPPAQATVYVATNNQSVLSLNLKTLRYSTALSTPKLPTDPTSIAVEPNTPKTIAVSSSIGTALWDLGSRQPVWNSTDSATAVSFQPDDSGFVVQDTDGVTFVPLPGTTDGGTGQKTPTGPAYSGTSSTLATPADTGTLVAAGSDDGTITIIDPARAGLQLPAAPGSTGLAFDPAGHLVLTNNDSSDDRTSSLYLTDVRSSPGQDAYDQAVTYQAPASWGPDGEFYVNDVTTGDGLVFAAGQDSAGHAAAFAWNEKTGHAVHKIILPGSPRIGVDVQYDRQLKLVIVRDSNGQVDAWSTADWRQVMQVSLGSRSGTISLSPNGASLASAVDYDAENAAPSRHGSKLAIIDLRAHTLRQVPLNEPSFKVAYAPDGNSLAVAGATTSLRFVSPRGGRVLDRSGITLPGIPTGLAYSPDGSLLAVSLNDGRILVYNPQTGSLAYPPIPAGAYPRTDAIAWNPSGTVLAALLGQDVGQYTEAESVELLQLDPRQWKAQDCGLAGGNLTPLQWRQYAGQNAPPIQACTSPRPSTRSSLALREVNWQGVTLPAAVCGGSRPVKLNRGTATVPNRAYGTATVSALDAPAYGNLAGTGTASPVAALNVICSTGGTAAGQYWEGYVLYAVRDGALQSIGIITPRPAARDAHSSYIGKVQFSRGAITAFENFYTSTDADCCPSGHATSVWVYRDGQLRKQSSTVSAG